MKIQKVAIVSHYDFFRKLEESLGSNMCAGTLIDMFSVNDSYIESGKWQVTGDSFNYFKEALGSDCIMSTELSTHANSIVVGLQRESGLDTILFSDEV